MELVGKVALVTGAAHGIGRAVAQVLAREGCAVAVHYRTSAAEAEALAAALRAGGRRARAIRADVTVAAEVEALVAEVEETLGGLDILVNNAGVTRTVDFLDTSEELYEELFRINLKSYFFCAQVAVPHIAARGGGSILNITSIHAFGGAPRHTAYAATKGAIVAFTRQLAIELVPQRIRVNAIGPGVIEVPRYFATMPGYRRAIGNSWVPWGRVGLPEDVARVAVFLVSDAAEFTTGQVLYVDGGHTARLAGLGVQPEERSEGGPGSR